MNEIKYVSTRGQAPLVDFQDALLAGLAPDGGLYLPDAWPEFSADQIFRLAGLQYEDAAVQILLPFVGSSIEENELEEMIVRAYSGFRHAAIAPVKQIQNSMFMLELFHGPTLAFKDFALQLVAQIFDKVLQDLGSKISIIGATSGDTGSAAIEAFRDSNHVDLFILYPHGRISDVQRRQMTTPNSTNVHAFAIDGDFDDCQRIVKALFADKEFRAEMSLSGINSINWARVMAQTVYFFTSAVALGAPDRSISFTVPTGNFGDIFAGWAAKRMGLPIKQLVIATNQNDILCRALDTGRYEPEQVSSTISPSMDIQVSSNFERILFEFCGRDANSVRSMMQQLQLGGFDIPADALEKLRNEFFGDRSSEEATRSAISWMHAASAEFICPHTAVGLAVARRLSLGTEAMVILATAHAAKFPDAVRQACGKSPPIPKLVAKQALLPEHFKHLANLAGSVKAEMRKVMAH